MIMPKQNNGIEWIGKIPKTWEFKKIKFLLLQRIEKNNPVRTKDILSLTVKQGVIPLSEKEGGGNKPKEDISGYVLAYPGDIVMNSMNVLSGSVGLSKYFGCVSPVYYMLKPLYDNDVRFYNYIFQTKDFQNSLLGLGNGILIKESDNGKYNTIRMRIPIDKLLNLVLPTVDAFIQKKISDFLDEQCFEIDALYADIEKQIDVLEQYKKSVITEAVTKGLDSNVEMKDSGIEWIGKIPKDWKVEKVKFHLLRREPRNPGNQQVLSVYREYGVIPKDSRDDNHNVTSQDTSNYKYIRPGNFVINKMKAWQGSMGISHYEGIVSPAYFVYCFKDYLLVPEYLHYLFRNCYKDEFRRISGGIREGQWDLSPEAFANTMLLLPSVVEQNRIVEYLGNKCAEIDSAIADKKKQLETLDAYKKSLIYEYVTGKKEVSA